MRARPTGSVRTLLMAAAVACIVPSSVLAQGGGGGGGGGGGEGGPRGRFGGLGGFGFFGGPGGMGQLSQALSKESLDQYARMLHLTEEQRQGLDRSFEAYQERVKTEEDAAREAARQAMQDARDAGANGGNGGGGGGPGGPGAAARRDIMGSMVEFRKHAGEMETAFMADFKGMLTPAQSADWPRVERARKREKATSGPMVASLERVDLIRIVEGLNLSQDTRGSLAPLLQQYEADLDKELEARAKVNDEMAAAVADGPAANGDFAQMQEKLRPVMDKAREASSKVQEVNRRYTSKVQTSLPEDKRPAFVRAVKEARFSDVYTATRQLRAMDTAAAFEDIDEAQKVKLKSLRGQYAKDLESVNARLAVAMEKSEASPDQQGGPMGFRRPDPETRSLRQEKSDLNQDALEKLRAILSQAQRDRLPQGLDERRGGPGGPGGPGRNGPGGNTGDQRRGGGGGG